jgi:hypothetical protein
MFRHPVDPRWRPGEIDAHRLLDRLEPGVIDDEVQVREIARGLLDVARVPRIFRCPCKRQALVEADVLDAERRAFSSIG